MDPVDGVRDHLARDEAMRAVVGSILDRCDRGGRMPMKMVFRCRGRDEQEAAVRLLSAAAVRSLGQAELSLLLDLGRADDRLRAEGWSGLSEVLYAAAGRLPRNLWAETTALGEGGARRATALAISRAGAAAAFLRREAERLAGCRGEMFALARAKGLEHLEEELDVTSRCIELAERNEGPLRLANFARRATGSTKGLRAGDRRYARVVDALLLHVPALAERVGAEESHPAERRRLALECLGIFRNETPIDVLSYGHFVLEKRGQRFDGAARHLELGEPSRHLLAHLRGARVVEVIAERVVSIENETTFNDYVEWLRVTGRREIVLLSDGQANWAVVRLLGMLAESLPSPRFVHWGDLDRSGVLILRSLRRRAGLPIEPLWMDVATFERFAGTGLVLSNEEHAAIAPLLVSAPSEPCADLLRAIHQTGRWVEQESVAEEVLRPEAVDLTAREPQLQIEE